MSLDQYHHFITAAQFTGQIGKNPSMEDKRYISRRRDGKLYIELAEVPDPMLIALKTEIDGYQAHISSEYLPDLPAAMIGNTRLYTIMLEVLTKLSAGDKPESFQTLRGMYLKTVHTLQSVNQGCMLPVTVHRGARDISTPDGSALIFRGCREDLMRAYDAATYAHRSRLDKYELLAMEGKVEELSDISSPLIKGDFFSVASYGSLVRIKVGAVDTLITTEHFSKLADFFCSFRNLSLLMSDIIVRTGTGHIEVMRKICNLGIRNQAYVGSSFRVLRSYIMAKGADPDTALNPLVHNSIASADGLKREFGEEVIDLALSITDSYTELTQLGGLYKYTISPDISMKECFEAAWGSKEPNKVKPSSRTKYRGLLRKRIFLNLLADKVSIHAGCVDEGLNEELNKPSPNTSVLEKVPLSNWASVTFSRLAMAGSYKDVELKVNDKSSANDMANPPLVEISGYNAEWLAGKEAKSIANVSQSKKNDILHALENNVNLKPKEGFKRFKKLVSRHLALDKKLMITHNVEDRYQIPSSALSGAILENEDLYYTVNTEPKEGEYHKPAGRLFYMATRDMKAFISSVERLCRTIFHGQVGNSIVASYMKRELQLRSMARATAYSSAENELYFVSFDMSEFSKRFPMELVNEIGEVFAELTGDNELAYLDVIFRAGVVVHSTRGYEGVFAGVKGGFEGFLNFVWTASHVTIMELALLEIQKQGVVMAYSDDGLLEFIVPKTAPVAEKKLIVDVIQETYANLGLTFHISKTLISTNTFEYLGLIAKDGRFVDTWGKSLAMMGIMEQRDAFTPFMDIINTYVSQATACITALCPVDLIYYHMFVDVVLAMMRRIKRLNIDEAIVIAVLPKSFGGLGVPNQIELSLTTERPSVENFFHRAIMMLHDGNEYMSGALKVIFENLCSPLEMAQGYFKGNYITVNVPSCDPTPILQDIAEMASSKAGFPQVPDPLTPAVRTRILAIMKNFKNFPMEMFSQIVAATPKMIKYQSRLEIASSRGAFTFVGRRSIKEAQVRDRAAVARMFNFWGRELRPEPPGVGINAMWKIVRSARERAIRYGFAPLRMRAETLMSMVTSPDNAMMAVTLNLGNDDYLTPGKRVKKVADAIFHAPDMNSGLPDMLPKFETSERLESKIPDKMLKIIGRIVAICPESLEGIFKLVSILGAEIPNVPSGVRGDMSRLRAVLRGKPSIAAHLPQAIYALLTIDFMHDFLRVAHYNNFTDNSTHVMTARALATIYYQRKGVLANPFDGKVYTLWFKMLDGADVASMLTEDAISVQAPFEPVDYEQTRSTRAGGDSVKKLISEMRIRASVISLGNDSVEMRNHVAVTLSKKLARQVYSKMRKLPYSPILDEKLTTDDERINSFVIKGAFFETFLAFSNDNKFMGRLEAIEAYLSRCAELEEELPPFMNNVSLRAMLYDGKLEAYEASTRVATLVSPGLTRSLVVGDLNSPAVYRKVLSDTIGEMYSMLRDKDSDLNWNMQLTLGGDGELALVPVTDDGLCMDDILDSLTVMREALRHSSHRSTPYNITTFSILYCKLVVVARRMMYRYQDKTREEALALASEAKLDPSEVAKIESMSNRSLGPDHKSLLRSTIGLGLGKRLRIYMRLDSKKKPTKSRRWMASLSSMRTSLWERASALQTFMNNVMTKYMSSFALQVPIELLRSAETSYVLSGMWQLRHVITRSQMITPDSEYLVDHTVGELLASQMTILMRKLALIDKPICLVLPISADRVITYRMAGIFGKQGIEVIEDINAADESESVVFELYPGELHQVPGKNYVMVLHSDEVASLVTYQYKIASLSEAVSDVVEDRQGYILVSAFNVLERPDCFIFEDDGFYDANDTAVVGTELTESDAKLVCGPSLPIATDRRAMEAGLRRYIKDPLEINPTIFIAGETGIGASRKGGWEGRIISKEYGLAAASYHSHVAATVDGKVFGAALALSSLMLDKSAAPEEIMDKAAAYLGTWKKTILDSPYHLRRLVRRGLMTEIAEMICWLKNQSFRLPLSESVPSVLYSRPTFDYNFFTEATECSVLTRLTSDIIEIDDFRFMVQEGNVFGAMAIMEEVKPSNLALKDDAIIEESDEDDEFGWDSDDYSGEELHTGEISDSEGDVADFLRMRGITR